MIETVHLHYGSFIDGTERKGDGRKEWAVYNPYNNQEIGKISCATAADVHDAVETAYRVFHETMKKMPAHQRSEI